MINGREDKIWRRWRLARKSGGGVQMFDCLSFVVGRLVFIIILYDKIFIKMYREYIRDFNAF